MALPADALRADFSRYAQLIEARLGGATFEPSGETATTVRVDRGIVLAQALSPSIPPSTEDPAARLIELANHQRIAHLSVIDAAGHRRPVYRPLLLYAWLLSFRVRYETLSPSEFGRWDESLRFCADLLESELGVINLTDLPAARGDQIAAGAWTALALHVAGKLFIRDAWTDLASDTFGRIARGQQPSGAFLLASASDNPEPVWYHELAILHAAANYAAQAEDRPLARAVARAAEFHLAETQPDHATSQPWALFAFIWSAAARPLADQLLHGVTLSGPDGVSLILLADALYCLRLFL